MDLAAVAERPDACFLKEVARHSFWSRRHANATICKRDP
jgi:hypothetical protein